MKDKTTCKRIYYAQIYNGDILKEKLEKMALKGWKLKSINSFFEFEKIEPQKIKYYIDYFSDSSIYSTTPENKSSEYVDYCKQAGWDFVAMTGNFFIFCSQDENAIEIQTDENIKFEEMSKSIVKSKKLSWGIAPLIIFVLINSVFKNEYLKDVSVDILFFVMAISILYIVLFDVLMYLFWKVKNKKLLRLGQPMQFYNKKVLEFFDLSTNIIFIIDFIVLPMIFSFLGSYIFIFILLISLFLLLSMLISNYFITKKKRSAIDNQSLIIGSATIILTIMFCLLIAFVLIYKLIK